MGEWKEALCPMCGNSHGMINIYTVPGKPWTKVGQENYWEKTRDFIPDKPFGVVKSGEGRGTMELVRYYDIDEDTDGYFTPMKARLLQVLKEWLDKGWITREELEEVIQ